MSYDDGYDEYDENDSYPPPARPAGGHDRSGAIARDPLHDAETLLRRAIDIIATARTIPLSSSPMINRDEIIEILEEAVNRLPDELRQARWMLKERQEFVAKTRREADEILEQARAAAERMVQRTEVVRAAETRARQVQEAADSDARKVKHETEDFIDQRLGSFEILLDRLAKTVHAGRERLSIGVNRGQAEDALQDDRGGGFFDQDGSR
jgi:cell division septum initiation protein DivIVA